MKTGTMAGTLTRRAIFIYVVVFFLSLLAMLALLPRAMRMRDAEAARSMVQVAEEYNDATAESISTLRGLLVLQDFRDLLRTLREYPSAGAEARLQLYLSAYRQANADIFFLVLEDMDGKRITSSVFLREDFLAYLDASDYRTLVGEARTTYYSPILHPEIDFAELAIEEQVKAALYPFFFCSTYTYVDGHPYYLTAYTRCDHLLTHMESFAETSLDHILLQNQYGDVIYHNMPVAQAEDAVALLADKTLPAQLRDGGTVYYAEKLSDLGGVLIGAVGVRRILSALLPYLLLTLLLLLVPVTLLMLALLPLSRQSLQSVQALTKQAAAFTIGDPAPAIIQSGDEVETLSTVLHELIENVNRQSTELVEKEVQNAEDRYKLLTSQVDVHFVSNTMNIINIMARNGKTGDIQTINNALIRLLRNRLNATRDIFDTVEEEIELLRQYMLIVRYRYDTNISISYDMTPEAAEKRILKNILQLLVENSLFHGLRREDDSIAGSISVLCYTEGDYVVLEESDDGAGIPAERLQALLKNHFLLEEKGKNAHIGLRNIYERLELIYGDDFSMELASTENEGTSVIIQMPAEPKQQTGTE